VQNAGIADCANAETNDDGIPIRATKNKRSEATGSGGISYIYQIYHHLNHD
jgi:hypothetical protein